MNYYKHNIGDYRRDTNHLSLAEHGLYRQLLDTYYLDEKPLNSDLDKLMRSQCVRNADDMQMLKNILSDFFVLQDDGYHHYRCDKELEEIYAKSEKARISAKARWRNSDSVAASNIPSNTGKSCERIENECERIQNACDSQCEGNATYNPLPKTKNKTSCDSSEPPAKAPDKELIELYNQTLGSQLPKAQMLTAKRKAAIKQRWTQTLGSKTPAGKDRYVDLQTGLVWWERFFEKVKRNPHWMGENDRGWKADFDWIINPSNFVKILEYNPSKG
jgi:uncharacterized protein YdaU (DUF1376 family)